MANSCRTRRNSESGLASDYWDRSSTPGANMYSSSSVAGSIRQKTVRKTRKPRSWHPSPYASDDEDDLMSREEKKQKIKAEIARRRQQIEENSRLHEELLRLASLRESAELGYSDIRSFGGPFDQSPQQAVREPNTSCLRSIDEILRGEIRDPSSGYYGGYPMGKGGMSGSPPTWYGSNPVVGVRSSPRHYYGSRGPSPNRYPLTEEDRSMARLASTFQDQEYLHQGHHHGHASLHDRIAVAAAAGDYSPLTTDLADNMNDFTPAMPLLPDITTRSRKLLEDLTNVPINSGYRGKYDQRRYRK